MPHFSFQSYTQPHLRRRRDAYKVQRELGFYITSPFQSAMLYAVQDQLHNMEWLQSSGGAVKVTRLRLCNEGHYSTGDRIFQELLTASILERSVQSLANAYVKRWLMVSKVDGGPKRRRVFL